MTVGLSARLEALLAELNARAEAAHSVAQYLPSGQASASRGSAGAYTEAARLLAAAIIYPNPSLEREEI